jgi:hypothetical protein
VVRNLDNWLEVRRFQTGETQFVKYLHSWEISEGCGLIALRNFQREAGENIFGNLHARGLAPIYTLSNYLEICPSFGTV